ncbi:hypothetical protein Q7P37_005921 [Cladosporium fusiforme]
MSSPPNISFSTRLKSFEDQWPDNQTAARQLAALGHLCDRPPLESLEEGSRCISCGLFTPKERSILALGGPLTSILATPFHSPKCIRLQLRIPIETQTASIDYASLINRWERRSAALPPSPTGPRSKLPQTSSLFSLPTELRLQIYAYILPSLSAETEIVPLHRDSPRIITKAGFSRPARRDKTKANLLLACKAVYLEALDLLYAKTTFRFENTRTLYLFLRHVGAVGRGMLRSLDVTCGQREDAVAFALLGACEELRNLTLRLGRPKLLLPVAPLWMLDGVACLLALRGLEEVRFAECSLARHMDMSDDKADAAIVRREVMRKKGEVSGVREVDGVLDL